MPSTPTIPAADPLVLAGLAGSIRPDDDAQEVLLAALERPPVPRTSLTAWFHGAVHLRGLQVLRAEGSRRARERRAARPESIWDERNELEQEERRQVLARGLADLDAHSRAILRAYYWEGLSLTAIADRDACSLGSVKRRHAAALQQLRAQLGDPTIDRRDWALLPVAWTSAAGLALALGAVLLLDRPGAEEQTPLAIVPTTALQPATEVAARETAPMVESTPTFKLTPSHPPSSTGTTAPGSVPMLQLQPATPIEAPELPEPHPVLDARETTIAAVARRTDAPLGS